MPEIIEGFGYYDVKGVDRPLLLSDEHAKEIKAKPHGEAEEPKATPTKSAKD
jgi:hypothetical protein